MRRNRVDIMRKQKDKWNSAFFELSDISVVGAGAADADHTFE